LSQQILEGQKTSKIRRDFSTIFEFDRKSQLFPEQVDTTNIYKKAVLPQGNRAMPQVFFSVEVRQQHSLQV